jgi:hypothetical protein
MKPTSKDQVICSTRILERIRELTERYSSTNPLSYDERHELQALTKLNDDCHSYRNFYSGTMLIRDSYIVEYAKQLAANVKDWNDLDVWPVNCIDWPKAALDMIRKDCYVSVYFNDVPYWIRK